MADEHVRRNEQEARHLARQLGGIVRLPYMCCLQTCDVLAWHQSPESNAV